MRNLIPMRQPNLRLNKPAPLFHLLPRMPVRCRLALGIMAVVSGEAPVLDIVLDEEFFFLPAVTEPEVEFFVVEDRDRGGGEAAPVHVNGFRGAALEVGGAEGEDVLAVAAAAG